MNCRDIWASSLCGAPMYGFELEHCFRLRGHSGDCGWIALPPPPIRPEEP